VGDRPDLTTAEALRRVDTAKPVKISVITSGAAVSQV